MLLVWCYFLYFLYFVNICTIYNIQIYETSSGIFFQNFLNLEKHLINKKCETSGTKSYLFLYFVVQLARASNGSCSNGFLKEVEEEEETGITFRVGKFIGQVTIESKFLLDRSLLKSRSLLGRSQLKVSFQCVGQN